MIGLWNKDKRSKLEKEIDSVLEYVEDKDPTSEEYAKAVAQLVKLYEAKKAERPTSVSPDVKWAVIGNVVIAVGVLTYERAGAITTKLTSFLYKGRV